MKIFNSLYRNILTQSDLFHGRRALQLQNIEINHTYQQDFAKFNYQKYVEFDEEGNLVQAPVTSNLVIRHKNADAGQADGSYVPETQESLVIAEYRGGNHIASILMASMPYISEFWLRKKNVIIDWVRKGNPINTLPVKNRDELYKCYDLTHKCLDSLTIFFRNYHQIDKYGRQKNAYISQSDYFAAFGQGYPPRNRNYPPMPSVIRTQLKEFLENQMGLRGDQEIGPMDDTGKYISLLQYCQIHNPPPQMYWKSKYTPRDDIKDFF